LGGDFRQAGEIPGKVGENLVQNIVADYLGQLQDPYDTSTTGRLVNDTSTLEPMNLIEDPDSCSANLVWNEESLRCIECPRFENVVFSDKALKFEADSQTATIDDGRIVLINREASDVAVIFKSKPSWIEFTSAIVNGTETKRFDIVETPPIALASGERMVLTFLLRTSTLGAGTDRTALGTVAFGVQDGGRYPGCIGRDATFNVELRVTPPDDFNYLRSFFYVGVAFAAVVLVTSICFVSFVYMHRNTRVIKVMQPMFLVTVCLGVTIMAGSMIPMGIDDGIATDRGTDIACMSIPWLLSTGFTIAFSALFSKLWRINKLFNASEGLHRIVVRTQDVLIPFAILFTVNIILLIAWTVVDPLLWERFSIDNQDWNTYGSCVGGTASTVFVSLIASINLLALFMACYQAFLSRNISDEFSESKYIGVAVLGWLQIALIGVPILFLIDDDNPSAQYFLQVSLVFVISMSMILIVFAPAFVNFRKRDSRSENRIRVSGIVITGQESQSEDMRKRLSNPDIHVSVQNRRDLLGVMDSIDEGTGSAVEKYQHSEIRSSVENAVLDSSASNRQKMIEQHAQLKDSSMAENIARMMAEMESDSDSDSDYDHIAEKPVVAGPVLVENDVALQQTENDGGSTDTHSSSMTENVK
jgi:hypothetical protein